MAIEAAVLPLLGCLGALGQFALKAYVSGSN
jgi:hypothetical protein